MPRPTLSLRVSSRMVSAVVGGVEFLLADLEDAGLALAQRQQFQRGFAQRLGAGILGQQLEVRLDARLRLLELLLDRVQRIAVVCRQRRRHVGGHQIGAGDHVAEQLDRLRRRGRIVAGKIGRTQDRVDLALGVHHGRRRSGDEIGLRLAQRGVLLVVQGCDVEPLARGRAQALDHVVDVLDGLGERGDHRLVGAHLDDLAELLQRQRLGFLHLLGALVERFLAARGQERRSLARKARALRRQLQAGGQAGDVAAGQVDHGIAELSSTRPAPALITIAMAAITAKAVNRLPLMPIRGKRKRLSLILPMLKHNAIAGAP